MPGCQFPPIPPYAFPPGLPIPKVALPFILVTIDIGLPPFPFQLVIPFPPGLPIPKVALPFILITIDIGLPPFPFQLVIPFPPGLPIPKIALPFIPPPIRFCPLDGSVTVG